MVFPESFTPKPADYRGIEEWHQLNKDHRRQTSALHHDSKTIRYQSQETRNQVARDTEWRAREAKTALIDRETDIVRWREVWQTTRLRVQEQISEVRKVKKLVEGSLRDKEPYLAAALRCLEMRDRRRDSELVRDRVHHQLRREVQFLEDSKRQLVLLGQELWESRFKLNESSQAIQREETGKLLSSQEDNALVQLNKESPEISFKPTALQTPKNIMAERHWMERMRVMISQIDETVGTCGKTVRSAYSLIRKLELELREEREKTRTCVIKRIQEIEGERDSLNRQKIKLEDEISRLYREILESEDCLKETNSPLKLAQTRLEVRKWARNSEITHDFPRQVLHSEVEATIRTLAELDGQIRKSKQNLFFLQEQLYAVTKASQLKDDTLKIENLSFKIHQNPRVSEFRDRSLQLASNDFDSSEKIFHPQSDLLDEFYQNLKITDNCLNVERNGNEFDLEYA